MLKKVSYVSVFVKDQDKALDFYTNVLGFEKAIDSPTPNGPRFLTVGVKGQDFQLVLWPGTPGQGQPVYGRASAAYTIEVSDCRKMLEALKLSGVKLLRCSRILTATCCSCDRAANTGQVVRLPRERRVGSDSPFPLVAADVGRGRWSSGTL